MGFLQKKNKGASHLWSFFFYDNGKRFSKRT